MILALVKEIANAGTCDSLEDSPVRGVRILYFGLMLHALPVLYMSGRMPEPQSFTYSSLANKVLVAGRKGTADRILDITYPHQQPFLPIQAQQLSLPFQTYLDGIQKNPTNGANPPLRTVYISSAVVSLRIPDLVKVDIHTCTWIPRDMNSACLFLMCR